MRAVHGFFRIRAAQSETLLVDMAAARFSILFLCKWNAGRSIFAEYLTRQLASQRFEAFSAGVTPVGHVSRVTLKVLKDHYQVDASDARSKSWHEFQDHQLDFIVC